MPSDYRLGFVVLPFRKRHWIAIRQINNVYWNLDSKLNAPERIGDESNLQSYLNNHLQSNDKELFIVVSSDKEKSKEWMKSDNDEIK